MATLTIRMPDHTHARLKQLASSLKVSLNKLMEDSSLVALAEFDAEMRFRARAARGSIQRGLELLDKLDRAAQGKRNTARGLELLKKAAGKAAAKRK